MYKLYRQVSAKAGTTLFKFELGFLMRYFMIHNIVPACVTPQAEGTEVSAELEFLNQQNMILSMENKALKQRLESIAQEQLIKYCKLLP